MNILDYIRERGDLSFKADPFNEVDNLVFAQMIYAGFEKYLGDGQRMTIGELGKAYFDDFGEDRDISRIFNKDGVMTLKEAYKSPRYKDLPVYNFVSRLDKETTEQFTAVMVDLPDRTTVVCFKGTDEHMIGWKEDCFLSYKDIVGQTYAVNYINQHCSIFRQYRILGHSKGGNLALYSALRCNPLLRMRIKDIYSDDGPGLRPGSFKEKEFDRIKDRYHLIVPEKDGVGTIYEMAKRKTIARIDTRNIIEAHSMMRWQIKANHIQHADGDSYQTDRTRQALVQFLKDTTPKEREIFTEEVFKAFDDAKITTVSELAHGGLPIILKVAKELSEMDTVAKSTAMKLTKAFSTSITSDLYKSMSEKKDAFFNKIPFGKKEEKKDMVEQDQK